MNLRMDYSWPYNRKRWAIITCNPRNTCILCRSTCPLAGIGPYSIICFISSEVHLTNCYSVGVFPWDDQFFMKLSIEGSLLYQFYLNLRYANCVIRHARCHEPRGRVIQVTNNFNCNISGSLYTSTFLGLSPLGRVAQCWLGLFPEPDPFSWALTWNTAPMQSMQSKKLN